jgi:hypothetical protein
MKPNITTQICAVLCMLFFAVSSFADDAESNNLTEAKSAYSRIAPYVNNDTFLVVRIDFASLDAEQFGASWNEMFTGYMKERGFEKSSINAVNREFRKTLEVVKKEATDILAIREAIGVHELFFVMQKQSASFRIIAPLTSEQQAQFNQMLTNQFPELVVSETDDCILIDSDQNLETNTYRYFKPEPNTKLTDFLSSSAGSFLQIYCSNLKIQKLLTSANEEELGIIGADVTKFPDETRKGFESFDSYFQYALISYDFNTFSYKSQYFFTTAERAEDFKLGLEKFIIVVADSVAEDLKEGQDAEIVEKYNIDGLTRELVRGALLSFIPKRSDSVLVFEANLQTKTLLTHPAFLFACLCAALERVN